MGLWLLSLGSSLFCHCSCHRRVLSFLRGYSPFLRGVSSHSLLRLVLGPLPSRGHRLLHGCTLPHRYASFICGVLGRPSLRLMELRGSRLPSLASSGLVCLSCVCLVAVAPRGYVSFFRGSSSHFLLGFVLGLTSSLLELRGFRLPSLASSGLVCLTCGCFVAVAPRGHSSFFRGSSSHYLLGFVLGLSSPRGHFLLHGCALPHRYASSFCGSLGRLSSRGHWVFHGSASSPRRHASFLCGMHGRTFTRLVPRPSSSRGNGFLHGCTLCIAMAAWVRGYG